LSNEDTRSAQPRETGGKGRNVRRRNGKAAIVIFGRAANQNKEAGWPILIKDIHWRFFSRCCSTNHKMAEKKGAFTSKREGVR